MTPARIEQLLDGEEPSLDDYSGFVRVAEQLNVELLWQMAISYPQMHWMLQAVVQKNLEEKIPKEKTALAMNSIYKKLEESLGKKP